MRSIRLKNYKCFEDTGAIPIKPLTFLVGSNSSGKSSFLEFFALLQQSMFTNREGAFLWVGNNVDLNDFNTVIRKGMKSITIEMVIDNIPVDSGPLSQTAKSLNNVKIEFEISNISYGDSITWVRIAFNDQIVEINLNEKETDQIRVNGEGMGFQDEQIVHSGTNSLFPQLFFGMDVYESESPKGRKELYTWIRNTLKDSEVPLPLIFRLRQILDKKTFVDRLMKFKKQDIVLDNIDHIYNLALFVNINSILNHINYYMLDFARRIDFIQPLRAHAERYYRSRNVSDNKLSPGGDNLAMFLLRLKREKRLEKFNDWLHDNGMQFGVNLKDSGGFVEIIIEEDGRKGINMIDVGFGYSQILPILVTIWKELNVESSSGNRVSYCNTSYVLIEQPELHLHPRFQRSFADMLTKCISQIVNSNLDIRFLIETHSQDILNSVGLSVANGQFDSSLVDIYLFNAQRENMNNYIEKATFTKDGFLDNWPIGFFD